MVPKFTNVQVGEGKFALEAQVCATPRGIVAFVYSPEHAHVGATCQLIDTLQEKPPDFLAGRMGA